MQHMVHQVQAVIRADTPQMMHHVRCIKATDMHTHGNSGGGAFYIEPPSAVPLNNELAAAKGEAAAAEEKVMWQLTGQIIDNLADIQAALDIVSFLLLSLGLPNQVVCQPEAICAIRTSPLVYVQTNQHHNQTNHNLCT